MTVEDKRALLVKGSIWRHYKGETYFGAGMGIHTETEEKLFTYMNVEGNLFHRPVEMFLEEVTVNGVTQERFQFAGLINMRQ